MERTESLVVQVAPDYENDKIKEMQAFGWNLQGRQEIHEKGDAYGRPSYIDSSTYLIKTTVYHYVKLHFSRSVSLPNLDNIRPLEERYFGLSAPPFPTFVPGGAFMLLFWWPFWFLYVIFSYLPKKNAAAKQVQEVVQERGRILSEVAKYL